MSKSSELYLIARGTNPLVVLEASMRGASFNENLLSWSKRELELAGLFDSDSDYDGAIGHACMDIVKVFSEQGHSGFSAGMVNDIVGKLMRYQPLTECTHEEYATDMSEYGDGKTHLRQCSRCMSWFSENHGPWYNIDDHDSMVRAGKIKEALEALDEKLINLCPDLDDLEYKEFLEFVENNDINEGILDTLKGGLKKKFIFMKDLAIALKTDLSKIISLFKDSQVFKFFQMIGWSFKKLFKLVQTGFKSVSILADVISNYAAETGIVKWTTNEIHKLDEYLKTHPKTKRMIGIAVAGILIYVWLNMSFSGDASYDFGMDDLLAALAGKMTLVSIFGGANGVKLLMLFTTGMLGLSFPWPGPQSTQFISAVVGTMAKKLHMKL